MQGAGGSNLHTDKETVQKNPCPANPVYKPSSPNRHSQKKTRNKTSKGHQGSVAMSPCGPCIAQGHAFRMRSDVRNLGKVGLYTGSSHTSCIQSPKPQALLWEDHANDSYHGSGALDGFANFFVFSSGWITPTGSGLFAGCEGLEAKSLSSCAIFALYFLPNLRCASTATWASSRRAASASGGKKVKKKKKRGEERKPWVVPIHLLFSLFHF